LDGGRTENLSFEVESMWFEGSLLSNAITTENAHGEQHVGLALEEA
jgi:hypothetical protein